MSAAADIVPAVSPYTTFRVRVHEVRQLTPHMRRITFRGPELAGCTSAGLDQRLKLLLPLPGQDEPVVPPGTDWYAGYRAMAEDVRPWMRTYTIRAFRPAATEIDVDFVLHGDTGPASAWAQRAAPGDRVAIVGPDARHSPIAGYEYRPADDAGPVLLVGDETALPAIGGILDALPAGRAARVFVEVSDLDEVQSLGSAADVEITWLPRCGTAAGRSRLLLDCVRESTLPGGSGYAWIAAESAAAKAVRRLLVNERGMDRKSVYFAGYWRLGAVVG